MDCNRSDFENDFVFALKKEARMLAMSSVYKTICTKRSRMRFVEEKFKYRGTCPTCGNVSFVQSIVKLR